MSTTWESCPTKSRIGKEGAEIGALKYTSDLGELSRRLRQLRHCLEEVAQKRDAYRMLRHMRTQEPIVWAMLDAEIYWQAKWCLSTSSGNCAHAGRVQ